jgi:hypothetical protein
MYLPTLRGKRKATNKHRIRLKKIDDVIKEVDGDMETGTI